jgi:sugar O-acyltransferase (sialic acid O-acetyltransferase NeuD family)
MAEHLGTLEELGRLEDAPWILAIGDLDRRRLILDRIVDFARPPVSVVHPAAFVSPSADLGLGVYVGPGAVVHTRATIGDSAIINSAAVVEHDTTIGPNTHVAPGAILGGTTTVGCDTLVGLGSRVLPNISIGDRCTIGAGAVVTRNVPNDATVVGVPAGEMKRSST